MMPMGDMGGPMPLPMGYVQCDVQQQGLPLVMIPVAIVATPWFEF